MDGNEQAPEERGAEYGKLQESYRSLRADYTRKCQRLAELERLYSDNPRDKAEAPRGPEELLADEEFVRTYVLKDRRVIERVLAEYGKAAPPLMSAAPGSPPAVEEARPRSLAEAGELAKKTIVIR